jgi:pilus assembly protein CpaE
VRSLEHALAAAPPPAVSRERRILAYLRDADSEAATRAALADLTPTRIELYRGGVDRAIAQLAAQRSPGVLIVDLSGSDLPVSDITRLAEVCEPGVDVIAIGEHNDIGLYRDLLRAGVTDYLVKPLTAELLRRAVTAALVGGELRSEPKLGKRILVSGSRGGVGTTTVSVNLAWHLAEKQDRRVALLDLDLAAGDCGLLLDLKPTDGLRRALEAPDRIDAVFIERTMAASGDKLKVMSAAEPFADDIAVEANAVNVLLRSLQSQFHYVIIDLPRSQRRLWPVLGRDAAVRVIVADAVLSSLRDVRRFRKSDSSAQTLLVVNRRGEFGRAGMKLDAFSSGAELAPVATMPFDTAIALAADTGKPAAARGGRFATAIAALAGEISGQKPARPAWLRLFT